MIFRSPQDLSLRNMEIPSVFLAGSIETGKAIDWQTDIGNFLSANGFTVFNPRRDEWDASWAQEFENPQFFQQVNWEIDGLEKADHIIMYFEPSTLSPISLLELGLFARSGKLLVVCPHGYWRKGNVDIVCSRFNIPTFDSLDSIKEFFLKKP